MADYVTHDGREITVDVHAISHVEFKKLMTPESDKDEELIAKACGMSVEQIDALSEHDWRGLIRTVIKRISNPDPL